MNNISLKARAKINIALDVQNKRDDGYHNLEMIMQTIDLYDKIWINKINTNNTIIKTNVPFLPTDSRNLVYKIVEYMKNEYYIKQGVFIDLYKVIPIAAGLAGGSADAAATIKGMNELFHLRLSKEEMKIIGKKFGADIPYCLEGGTALATGIGDELRFLEPFPKCFVVIVKPIFSASTQYVYQNLKINEIVKRPKTDLLIKAIEAGDLYTIGEHLCNVLETVTIKLHPQINDVKKIMIDNGAIGALMSGSGSSVFGLFDTEEQAKVASKILKEQKYIKFVFQTSIYNREV